MNRKIYLKQNIRLVLEHIILSMLKVFTVVISPSDGLEIYNIYIFKGNTYCICQFKIELLDACQEK